MSLDLSSVEKIAHLARLDLTDAEKQKYCQELSKILDTVAAISQVNTDGVEPMSHPMDAVQRMREDEISEHNQRDAFLALAPAQEAGLYLVPKVIE
jgi:aspartyl-tRNA(Asn)/glutamyl-tRNA(Gln) amidotransferase subunit C